MSLDKSWDKYFQEMEGNMYAEISAEEAANHFQKRAIEEIMKLEDRLYEDSDQTTSKELLWEIKGIIESLKP